VSGTQQTSTGQSTRPGAGLTGLALVVVFLGLALMGLGAAVLAVKLRPPAAPSTAVEADLQVLEQATLAYPDSGVVQTTLGMTLLDAGRPDEARTAFARAVELDPDQWMALLQLGLIDAPRDPQGAEELFVLAAERAPTRSKVSPLVALGDLRLESGDVAGARQAYEDAVADGPILIEGRLGLAASLEPLGEAAGALEQYREVVRYDPTNATAADGLARLDRTDT
jgi:tetratricopeptide (TPR) repeat protein